MKESATKIMPTVFWDAHSAIFTDYLQQGKTINRSFFESLLIEGAKQGKRKHFLRKKVLFLHDNALVNSSLKGIKMSENRCTRASRRLC